MKKLLLSLFLLLPFAATHAQIKKVEFNASVGYLSDAQVADAVANGVGSIILVFFVSHDFRITSYGIYSGEVLLALNNPKIQIEGAYNFEKLKTTEYNNDKTTVFFQDINTVLSGIRYNYVVHPAFRVYSGADIGARFKSFYGDTDNLPVTNFAYHLTFAGIRYGRTVAGFTEIGFGAKGILRTGLSFAF